MFDISETAVLAIAGFCLAVLLVFLLLGRRRGRRKPVVIDGSNVMHWDGEVPKLRTVQTVVAALKAKGFDPGIIFDANAGYKLADRYLDDRHFAKLLKLPSNRVLVVRKGQPADPTVLAAARDMGGQVVTNDRFRDWANDFPEVLETGHLIRGGYRKGVLWLAEHPTTGGRAPEA